MNQPKRRLLNLREAVRRWSLRILGLQGEPEQVARGMGLGIFLGFVLPPGTQTVVALSLAPIFRSNSIAAACGVWVTNPVTMPAIYPLALAIGSFLTRVPVRAWTFEDEESFWSYVISVPGMSRVAFLMFVGLLVLGSLGAFVSYHVTRIAVQRYRRRGRRGARRSPGPP